MIAQIGLSILLGGVIAYAWMEYSRAPVIGLISMLVGRFMLMIPVLAIAGSLGRKQASPPSAGTFPTNTPLFASLLTGVIVIVVGLTYFPVVALGPVVEQLVGKF